MLNSAKAWTGYGRMVLAPVLSAAASSLALVLLTAAAVYSLEEWTTSAAWANVGAFWLGGFLTAVPITALAGIVAHNAFWNFGWRRPWHYAAGAVVFALVGGAFLGGFKNPAFYVISSGIVGISGGLGFHWVAYRSR